MGPPPRLPLMIALGAPNGGEGEGNREGETEKGISTKFDNYSSIVGKNSSRGTQKTFSSGFQDWRTRNVIGTDRQFFSSFGIQSLKNRNSGSKVKTPSIAILLWSTSLLERYFTAEWSVVEVGIHSAIARKVIASSQSRKSLSIERVRVRKRKNLNNRIIDQRLFKLKIVCINIGGTTIASSYPSMAKLVAFAAMVDCGPLENRVPQQ
ncbi:hypothetical protein Tco_0226924 [Tanacetum coccineum]